MDRIDKTKILPLIKLVKKNTIKRNHDLYVQIQFIRKIQIENDFALNIRITNIDQIIECSDIREKSNKMIDQ